MHLNSLTEAEIALFRAAKPSLENLVKAQERQNRPRPVPMQPVTIGSN